MAGAGLADRMPLVCVLSRDGDRTLGEPVLIEDDPEPGFSYVAIPSHRGDCPASLFHRDFHGQRLPARARDARDTDRSALRMTLRQRYRRQESKHDS